MDFWRNGVSFNGSIAADKSSQRVKLECTKYIFPRVPSSPTCFPSNTWKVQIFDWLDHEALIATNEKHAALQQRGQTQEQLSWESLLAVNRVELIICWEMRSQLRCQSRKITKKNCGYRFEFRDADTYRDGILHFNLNAKRSAKFR